MKSCHNCKRNKDTFCSPCLACGTDFDKWEQEKIQTTGYEMEEHKK